MVFRLLSISDNRSHAISQRWVSTTEDEGVDEGDDDDCQADPGKVIKRWLLSWLHKGPKRKANCQHTQERQDQVFYPGKLLRVVFPSIGSVDSSRVLIGESLSPRSQQYGEWVCS